MNIGIETKEVKIITVNDSVIMVLDGEKYSKNSRGFSMVTNLPKEIQMLMDTLGGGAPAPAKKKRVRKPKTETPAPAPKTTKSTAPKNVELSEDGKTAKVVNADANLKNW